MRSQLSFRCCGWKGTVTSSPCSLPSWIQALGNSCQCESGPCHSRMGQKHLLTQCLMALIPFSSQEWPQEVAMMGLISLSKVTAWQSWDSGLTLPDFLASKCIQSSWGDKPLNPCYQQSSPWVGWKKLRGIQGIQSGLCSHRQDKNPNLGAAESP